MPRNRAVSAISVPPFLVLATVILLVLRLLVNLNDKPDHLPSAIHWKTYNQLTLKRATDEQLVFYYFAADWSDSCTTLEQSAFRDKTVVAMLNTEFVPVKIIDPTVKTAVKEKQELQTIEHKYNISAYPTFVVVLGDGTWVNSKLGNTTPKNLTNFLKDCEQKAGYCRALKSFTLNPAESAKRLQQWIKTCDWTDEDSIYASAYAALGYRLAKNEEAANKILDSADLSIKHGYYDPWPRPLLRYLKGTLPEKQLFEQIEFDHDALTTSKFFVAMDMKSKGKEKECTDLLKWIYGAGSHDTEAYNLATQELRRTQEQLLDAGAKE